MRLRKAGGLQGFHGKGEQQISHHHRHPVSRPLGAAQPTQALLHQFMEGGQPPALFRTVDQIVMHQDKGMEELQRKGGGHHGRILDRLGPAQGPVSQGKKQRADSFPLPPDVFTHIEIDRLKHFPVVVPLLLAVKKGLDLPLQQGGKRFDFVPEGSFHGILY